MRYLLIPVFLAASAASARAQEGLTATDVLDFGQMTVTGRLQLSFADFTQESDSPPTDLDLENQAYSLILETAIGIGTGVEVELRLPWQLGGTLEGDGEFSGLEAEVEQEIQGVGDLEASVNFRLVKESSALPHIMMGFVIVAPTGNDRDGDASLEIGGVEVQEEREGGIGEGIWKAGLQAGLSKRLGAVEPYYITRILLTDAKREDGVTEDAPTVWSHLLGAEIDLGSLVVDVRAFAARRGEERFADNGIETTAEPHWTYGAQAFVYLPVAPRVTIIASGGVQLVQDHEINDARDVDLEDYKSFIFQVGVHLFLGFDTKP